MNLSLETAPESPVLPAQEIQVLFLYPFLIYDFCFTISHAMI